MDKIAFFHLVAIPGTDTGAFADHLQSTFKTINFPATRITRFFSHRLLEGENGHYIWETKVELQTDAGYDFEGARGMVTEAVKNFAVLVGVYQYTPLG